MKILLSLPESPFDPTNGAARSMRTIAELMAAAGHQVRCVATTATEHEQRVSWAYMCNPPDFTSRGEYRGVRMNILPVTGSTKSWRNSEYENALDDSFDRDVNGLNPDILLCYGGHPRDLARFDRAKQAGVKIVFGLRNFGYPARGFLDFADGVLTSSRFLTEHYRRNFNVDSTPLPLPIWPEDVIAPFQSTSHVDGTKTQSQVYFTAINPTREKGQMILETVVRELDRARPDIPFLIVSDDHAITSPWARYPRVTRISWQANPKEIFAQTKALLVPSVWEEPAGRVIAEALLNGIPPIITDRGGMVETANGGAIVLPLAKSITPSRSTPVGLDIAQPWIDEIIRLHDSRAGYRDAQMRAALAGSKYLSENLTEQYEQYFEGILAGELTPAGCGALKK